MDLDFITSHLRTAPFNFPPVNFENEARRIVTPSKVWKTCQSLFKRSKHITHCNGLQIKAFEDAIQPLFLPVITAVQSDPIIFNFLADVYL